MTDLTPISVAYGDGIGPEIMTATLRILEAAGARIAPETIAIGEQAYLSGCESGIPDEAFESISRTRVILKAPITTPQGGGYKSLNVTLRKGFGLFANVRPCKSLYPCVPTNFPKMDTIIVRENEEGLYAGIAYRQSQMVYQDLKLISRPGCEKIIRFAFEYARKFKRKKVTAISKDNIMKMTDGMFHKIYDEIATEYPEIEKEHIIVDIGTALIASDPERFDVVVTGNLYGDIISDVAAQVIGSVGLAGSSNIGTDTAMFEAIHGSAPDISGQNIANPSGLLNGAILMLLHINQEDVASKIENAWLRTLEDGIHTGDIFQEGVSTKKVSTTEFADAVIERLGQTPEKFTPADYPKGEKIEVKLTATSLAKEKKELVGIDVYIEKNDIQPDAFAAALKAVDSELTLHTIANRGLKVWPQGLPGVFCSDHWRCRYNLSESWKPVDYNKILALLVALEQGDMEVIKTENLYNFDGERGFSLAQGE